MERPKSSFPVRLFLAATIAAWVAPSFAANYRVLHAFSGTPDGGGLRYRLAIDGRRNLYGTTTGGGEYGGGTVFELSPSGGGKWTETILHSFCPDWPYCSDGAGPLTAVVLDASGSLFGSVRTNLFRLTPEPGGWNFSLVYDKGSTGDLLADGIGNLYLEFGGGGPCMGGEIAKLKPPPDGGYWIAKDLYDFCLHNGEWSKGNGPNYGLNWDSAGSLYGVTTDGGKYSFGVVFQLVRTPNGWKERVLHYFQGGRDGFFPKAGVVVDSAGNVYGSTEQGGSDRCGGPGCGTIYRLTKQPDGHWKETILYRFPKLYNGAGPTGTLAIDAAGSLYGVAGGGTGPCGGGGCGVVFRLSPNPDGTWTYTVLHRFTGPDGAGPLAGLILDAKGHIFGTTSYGGAGGYGVVFKIVP